MHNEINVPAFVSMNWHNVMGHLLVAQMHGPGVFGSGTAWDGMEWFRSRGMEWFHSYVWLGPKNGTEWFHPVFGWRNCKTERIAITLLIIP
jgi:hypothetical protein